jgi:hypothetical protein
MKQESEARRRKWIAEHEVRCRGALRQQRSAFKTNSTALKKCQDHEAVLTAAAGRR